MSYSYVYDMADLGVLLGMIPLMFLPALIGIGTYVLSALGLYTLARRRGIHNPWLSWIPVADSWVLGSLSDQYRYVVRGENRAKRRILLSLSILNAVIAAAAAIVGITVFVRLFAGILGNASEAQLLEAVFGSVAGLLGLGVVAAAVSIAFAIVRFMALYDVYKSMDPGNCVVFLVLSIFIQITESFFLFFNRNKDLGMPPRREQPTHTTEPWENS